MSDYMKHINHWWGARIYDNGRVDFHCVTCNEWFDFKVEEDKK
jgi:hypothetical protein